MRTSDQLESKPLSQFAAADEGTRIHARQCITACGDHAHWTTANDPSATSTAVVSVDLVRAAERSEDIPAMSRSELERDVADYVRFLLLVQRHWHERIAPTKAIDRMWHLHMLHPRAYYEDCIRLFGEILDHDGGFGGTADEAPVLAEIFHETSKLWAEAYGTPYVGGAVACTRNCVSRCQRRCKTVQAAPTSALTA